MSQNNGGGGLPGHHPDQSPSWSSALQGAKNNKPITSLPNPTIVPIIGALVVFLIMLLPFIINWGDGGIELPWVTQRRVDAEREAQAVGRDNVGQIIAPAAESAALPDGMPTNRPQASFDQQLMYASQQGFGSKPRASVAQNYPQSNFAQNNSAQDSPAQNTYAQNTYAQPNYPQSNYSQPTYGQPGFAQPNMAQYGGGNYASAGAQPAARHRVFAER